MFAYKAMPSRDQARSLAILFTLTHLSSFLGVLSLPGSCLDNGIPICFDDTFEGPSTCSCSLMCLQSIANAVSIDYCCEDFESVCNTIPDDIKEKIIITEIGDIGNGVAFVELTNIGCSPITSTSDQSSLSLHSLSGFQDFVEMVVDLIVIFPPRIPIIITSDAQVFEDFFGMPPDVETPAAAFFESYYTNEPSNIPRIDTFGVPGSADFSEWSWSKGRAERMAGVTTPRPAFNPSEWTIVSTLVGLPPEAYDPFFWIGIQQLTPCPPLAPPSPPAFEPPMPSQFPLIPSYGPSQCLFTDLSNRCFDTSYSPANETCSCLATCVLVPGACCNDFPFVCNALPSEFENDFLIISEIADPPFIASNGYRPQYIELANIGCTDIPTELVTITRTDKNGVSMTYTLDGIDPILPSKTVYVLVFNSLAYLEYFPVVPNIEGPGFQIASLSADGSPISGFDSFELKLNGSVIDTFGIPTIDGSSLGIAFNDGSAQRKGGVTIPVPIFDEDQWTVITSSTENNLGSYNPSVWDGFPDLDPCILVGPNLDWCDIDDNGFVDVNDIVFLIKQLLQGDVIMCMPDDTIDSTSSGFQPLPCDIDLNGSVEVNDIIILQKISLLGTECIGPI